MMCRVFRRDCFGLFSGFKMVLLSLYFDKGVEEKSLWEEKSLCGMISSWRKRVCVEDYFGK